MNPGPLTCEASALPLSYIPKLPRPYSSRFSYTYTDEPTRDQVCFSTALGMPLFVVVTKVDKSTPEQVTQTTQAIEDTLLAGIGKLPLPVHDDSDVHTAAHNFRDGK